MNVHDVFEDVMETGWFAPEEKKLYGIEMEMALIGDAAGYPLVCGPFEVFAEVCEVARVRGNERAYYTRRFSLAMEAHVRELAELEVA